MGDCLVGDPAGAALAYWGEPMVMRRAALLRLGLAGAVVSGTCGFGG